MTSQILSFTQQVKAPLGEAYRAFTNATALREWLCDVATLLVHPGGRIYLAWNKGYYTSGEFTAVTPKEKLEFTWQGRGEPGSSLVRVSFAGKDGGTLVTLEHSGIGTGEAWSKSMVEIEKGWKVGLENLASVLESGEDLRLVRRPMLGITLGTFNADKAMEINVPITEGILLDGVLKDMGAEAAGLQKDDVLVSMAGKTATDFNSLGIVLDDFHGGDKVEVVFYRGPEKKTVMMELSKRPIPDIPKSAKELAASVQKIIDQVNTDLDAFLLGVNEGEAAFKPSPEEWSLKEVIAHFLQGERFTHQFISDLVFSQERVSDGYGENLSAYIEATVEAYPTLNDLVLELKRNFAETVGILERLPEEFVERKSSFWRLSYNMLQDPYHYFSHKDQMQAALDMARSKK